MKIESSWLSMFRLQVDIGLRWSAEKKSMVFRKRTVISVYVYTHVA